MPSAPSPDSHGARAEALRARMAQRLDGARFRYLNEQLYSGPSSAAQRLFQEDPGIVWGSLGHTPLSVPAPSAP